MSDKHSLPLQAKWTFLEHSDNIHSIVFEGNVGDSMESLLISDIHWDNPHCDRKLLKKHLDQAKEKNAPILINGDLFCLMQGKGDPRGKKDDIRPEHNRDNYIDAVVSTAVEWFEPYKDQIVLVNQGNHEANIKSRKETDVLARFCDKLRDRGGIARTGEYAGWVRFQAKRPGGSSKSFKMFYHHGSGGGAVVTHGVGDWAKMQVYLECDIIWAGHVHQQNYAKSVRVKLNEKCRESFSDMHLIRSSTYKNEWGGSTWHVQKGRGPRPMGGWWAKSTITRVGYEIEFSMT